MSELRIHATQSELAAALGKLTVGIGAAGATFTGDVLIEGRLMEPAKHALRLMQLIGMEQKDTAPPAVVVATPAVTAGLVLRWYRNASLARYLDAALVSASRGGVMLNGGSYLHDIPAAWIADASYACEMLRHGQRDRAREFATHEHGKLFAGEIVEIRR